jgi:hypothetical protein
MHGKWVSTLLVAVVAATASISIASAADTGPPPADPTAPVPPAASGEPSKPGDAPPPSVTIIGAKEAHAVLGRDVRSTSGEDMGRIVDIIVDKGGSVRAAVIDFGGFLGVGSRKIVVDWNALHFVNVDKKGDSITLDLTREQVKAAPEYSEDKPIVVLGASGKLQPLRFDP